MLAEGIQCKRFSELSRTLLNHCRVFKVNFGSTHLLVRGYLVVFCSLQMCAVFVCPKSWTEHFPLSSIFLPRCRDHTLRLPIYMNRSFAVNGILFVL